MNKKELKKLLSELKIDKEEFWILSSSALVLRDILSKANDLDIAVTEEGFRQLNENYNIIKKDNGMYQVLENVECFIDTKEDWKIEKHQNYNLENIEKYYKYLLQSKREKDILRIPIVEKYIKNSVKGFDD